MPPEIYQNPYILVAYVIFTLVTPIASVMYASATRTRSNAKIEEIKATQEAATDKMRDDMIANFARQKDELYRELLRKTVTQVEAITENNIRLKSLEQSVAQTKEELQKVTLERNAAIAERDAIMATVDARVKEAVEAAVKELTSRIKDLEERERALSAQVAALQEELREKNQLISELTTENVSLRILKPLNTGL